jgi:hypothetical protein
VGRDGCSGPCGPQESLWCCSSSVWHASVAPMSWPLAMASASTTTEERANHGLRPPSWSRRPQRARRTGDERGRAVPFLGDRVLHLPHRCASAPPSASSPPPPSPSGCSCSPAPCTSISGRARLHLSVAGFGLTVAAVAAVATLRRRLGRRWLLLQAWASTFGLLLLLGDHAHAVVLVPTGLLSLATCAASGLAVLVLLPWLRERERGAEPALLASPRAACPRAP